MPPSNMDPAAGLPRAVRALFPFEIRTFDRSGCRLTYVDEGPREAPVLLMVHWYPTWSFFYRSLVDRLKKSFRCIVPDHAGCGLSAKPQDYDYCLETHIENLGALLDHLRVSRAHLVVHDWGGAIGLGAARRRPGFVDRLVIFNTAAFPSRRIPKRIALCRAPGLGALLVRGGNAFSGAAVHLAVAKSLAGAVREGYLWPYRSYADRVAIHRFVRDIPLGPAHRSFDEICAIDESLAACRERPVMIRWGARDWCFDDWFLDEWRKRLPDAAVQSFANAGHWLLEDEPAAIGCDVETFLST